jgi:hypothetical protein
MTGRDISDAVLSVLLQVSELGGPGLGSVEVAWRVGLSMEGMHFVLAPLFENGWLDPAAPAGTLRLTAAGEAAARGLRI